jgi:hypothetical protein
MRQLPDLDMWVRLCGECEIFIHSEPLVQFRLRSDNANASADVSSNHERASYEWAKILKRYSRVPLSDQLPQIFPESFNDFETDAERLLDLAELAMDVQSPAHQLFGLDCLRGLAKTSGLNIDKDGARLLKLGLKGSPFSPPLNYLRVFHRPARCPFTAERSQSFAPDLDGERISIPIPPDSIQLRIDPVERIALVRIFHLSITDSDGVEVWSIERAPERMEIFNAKSLSTSERPFRLLALSNDPQIILPEIHPLEGWHLNLSLSTDSNIGAELQKLSLRADETARRNEAFRGRIHALKRVIESAQRWQEKPWYQRAFHRWTARKTDDIETS